MPEFEFDRTINHVTIVGAGGTGAQVARMAARILYDMRARNQHIPDLRIIDPDSIEAQNVGRQLFTEAEIGRNKAEVVARRLGMALGLQVEAIPTAYQDGNDILDSGIVVGCVDGEAGRNAIANHLHRQGGLTWIDCGNHENGGQIVLGTTDDWESIEVQYDKKEEVRGGGEKDCAWHQLPHAGAVFPALLKPEKGRKKQAQRRRDGCAEAVMAGTQHLLINDLIAAVAGQYLYALLHNQALKQWLTYVDGETLTMRSVGVSADEVSAYKQKKKAV